MAVLGKTREGTISGEELFHRPDLEPCELVEGRIVPAMPTGYFHGALEARLSARILGWAETSGRGRVLAGEVGIYIRRAPDTVRAADVLYISNERYARRGASGYLDVAPDLVVEVLSPDDRWSEVMEKLEDYFAAGVAVVWVVDPRLQQVFAYRSLATVEVLAKGQALTAPDLLPGFSLPLVDLFRE
ncbi:MAG TPA: Uma2 family endonuclease [Thermoanaerobaculia bacterium]|nr:Uma2 family endonuclease [Thermoanaerobaculia bacterium]